MLHRNLLYTAITRARNHIALIGQQDALRSAVRQTGARRHTALDTPPPRRPVRCRNPEPLARIALTLRAAPTVRNTDRYQQKAELRMRRASGSLRPCSSARGAQAALRAGNPDPGADLAIPADVDTSDRDPQILASPRQLEGIHGRSATACPQPIMS